MFSGTPFATLVEVPKLERMSRRTMPLEVRTFAPFEPSPGYGPAVSLGIAATRTEAGVLALVGMA